MKEDFKWYEETVEDMDESGSLNVKRCVERQKLGAEKTSNNEFVE